MKITISTLSAIVVVFTVILIAQTSTEKPVEGRIIIGLVTNVFDVMKSDREKDETTTVFESKSIRFDYENTMYEYRFSSNIVSQTRSNLMRMDNWVPASGPPPLPVATPINATFTFKATNAPRVKPMRIAIP